MTYPPWPINGAMVSGFPTPDHRTNYAQPPEVADRIGTLLKLSPMKSMIADIGAQARNFERYLTKSTDALVRLIEPDVDLFCYVNSITDWIAHKFWKYSDPAAPGYEPYPFEDSTLLEAFYEKTDASLGTILDAAPGDALVLVLSDHGTGPRSVRRFNTNAWLSEIGLLSRAQGQRARKAAASIMEWAKAVAPKKYWLWRHSPQFIRKSAGALGAYGGAIDWARTPAYRIALDHHVEGVNVNLVGREPRACVSESRFEEVRDHVLDAARALRDPVTGGQVLDGAYRREDVYHGEHEAEAPDIILILNPAYEFGLGSEREIFSDVAESRLGRSSATHRPDGILIMAGRGVKQAVDLGRASLLDAPATILWSLGLELPEDADGRVITEAFEEDLTAGHPVRRGSASPREVGEGGYTEEEERDMATHLEDLGYL
jgi:predicted AlkP superfamily phosphohydrolase/phosphomutase